MSSHSASRRQFISGAAGLAAATAATSVLAACSSTSTNGGTSSGNSSAISGQLNVWGGVPAASGPSDLISAFEKANPGVTVNYTQFTNDPTGNLKLDTALQGGAEIDVFFTYTFPELTNRVNAKRTLDITSLVNSDPDLKKLASPSYSPLYSGKLHAIPTVSEAQFVLINEDMMKSANIDIPEKWTVDDYHTVAKKLTKGGTHGAFISPFIAVPTLGQDAIYTKSGEANFTAAPWASEVQLAQQMAQDGSTFPESQILSQQLAAYQQNLFLTGKIGLWYTATWVLRYINDQKNYPHDFVTTFAPAPIPVGVSDPWNVGTFDNLMSISSASQNKDAAWAFLRYWATTGAEYMYKAGKLSPIQGYTQQAADALLGPNSAKLYDGNAFKRVVFDPNIKMGVPTTFTAGPQIAAAQLTQNQQLLLGNITADQWVSNMQSTASKAIAQAG